jgi:hypothetical protein
MQVHAIIQTDADISAMCVLDVFSQQEHFSSWCILTYHRSTRDIRRWDCRDGLLLDEYRFEETVGAIDMLVPLAKGTSHILIVSGSTVCIWDVVGRSLVAQLTGFSQLGPLRDISFDLTSSSIILVDAIGQVIAFSYVHGVPPLPVFASSGFSECFSARVRGSVLAVICPKKIIVFRSFSPVASQLVDDESSVWTSAVITRSGRVIAWSITSVVDVLTGEEMAGENGLDGLGNSMYVKDSRGNFSEVIETPDGEILLCPLNRTGSTKSLLSTIGMSDGSHLFLTTYAPSMGITTRPLAAPDCAFQLEADPSVYGSAVCMSGSVLAGRIIVGFSSGWLCSYIVGTSAIETFVQLGGVYSPGVVALLPMEERSRFAAVDGFGFVWLIEWGEDDGLTAELRIVRKIRPRVDILAEIFAKRKIMVSGEGEVVATGEQVDEGGNFLRLKLPISKNACQETVENIYKRVGNSIIGVGFMSSLTRTLQVGFRIPVEAPSDGVRGLVVSLPHPTPPGPSETYHLIMRQLHGSKLSSEQIDDVSLNELLRIATTPNLSFMTCSVLVNIGLQRMARTEPSAVSLGNMFSLGLVLAVHQKSVTFGVDFHMEDLHGLLADVGHPTGHLSTLLFPHYYAAIRKLDISSRIEELFFDLFHHKSARKILCVIGFWNPGKYCRRLASLIRSTYEPELPIQLVTEFLNTYSRHSIRLLPQFMETVVLPCLDPMDYRMRKASIGATSEFFKFLNKTFPMTAFSQTRQKFAIGNTIGEIVIYDLRSAHKWRVLEGGHSGAVSAVGFDHTGQHIASYSATDSSVKIWHIAGGGIASAGAVVVSAAPTGNSFWASGGKCIIAHQMDEIEPNTCLRHPFNLVHRINSVKIRWMGETEVLLVRENGHGEQIRF